MRFNKYWAIYSCVLLASIFIAAEFPITNDESYYIAYAKNLQLSYVDAPPFVSYLNLIQVKAGLLSKLSHRSLVIILHLLATLFLLAIVRANCANDGQLARKLLITFLIAYIVPIFGLFGIFILPDSGLILGLSIMIWVADKVVNANDLSWKHAGILGFGLGIGLLAKYHILPLGGGILLGILVDLTLKSGFSWRNLIKLSVSGFIGLLCALPLFIWNYENHYASFIFQLQHGFSSDKWQLKTMLAFILGSIAYLTPWFAFILLKNNLRWKKHSYLLIPLASLLIILLISSLRKSVLPHWISPAFWLLIPYAVIYSDQKYCNLNTLMRMCQYTALIWIVLIGVLLVPNGLLNIKNLSTAFNPDAKMFKDLLLWQELPILMSKNERLSQNIEKMLLQKSNTDCSEKRPIIGTFRWFWASQFEYHNMFPGAQILNLDQSSSSFYLWRDDWSNYANCTILLIGSENQGIVPELAKLMTINNEYVIHGMGDYRSLNLQVINATFLDRALLKKAQTTALNHPHY